MAHRPWTTDEDPAGCSKRPSSKAAASEEARRTLRYVEPLSDTRTKLADFFSILLDAWACLARMVRDSGKNERELPER